MRLFGLSLPFHTNTPAAESVRESDPRQDDDSGWHSISSLGATLTTEYDLSDWRGLARNAYEAYCTNPLAYAVIEQQTNFILGGGAHVVAEDPRVQRIVDAFWSDRDNDMDRRIYAIQTELAIFGEQFIRYFTDPITGRVVIRQLDPLSITGIETDPQDVERVTGYWYRPHSTGLAEPALQAEWIPAPAISHFAVNKVSGALRGRSDLAPVLRWVSAYSEWLADRVTQNKLKSAILYDVTLVGGSKEEITRRRAANSSAPRTGTVLFHTEKEIWKAVEPHIGAAEVRDDGRALRLMVATGAGIPEHYLGEGGNTNRATAAEMGLPAIKRMQRRQEYFRQVLETICRRVVDEAAKAGRIGPRVKRGISVQFEELAANQDAQASKEFAQALALAEDRTWVTPQQARRLWWAFVGSPEEGVHP